MPPFFVPPQVRQKIQDKHSVNEEEAREAFINSMGIILKERRAEHDRSYQKIWLISETDEGRLLKLVLAEIEDDQLVLISAYEPSKEDLNFYEIESKEIKRNPR